MYVPPPPPPPPPSIPPSLPPSLPQECYAVATGGIPISQAILKERYDYIFYTGNSQVKLYMYVLPLQYSGVYT